MKVVYITGCLGFIGSYVTRHCLKLGWHVRGIDKLTYAANQELLKEFDSYENFTFEKQSKKMIDNIISEDEFEIADWLNELENEIQVHS